MRFHVDNYASQSEKNEDRIERLHWISRFAIIASVLMYFSYIAVIQGNFTGHPSSPIPPMMAMVNASLWTAYGWQKTHKDWTLIIADLPGIILGFVALITIYVH